MPTDDKWDPSKPLDKDDEEEVQREARARARLKYLVDDLSKAVAPTPKKKKGIFSDRD
jgi:hypothetical protein